MAATSLCVVSFLGAPLWFVFPLSHPHISSGESPKLLLGLRRRRWCRFLDEGAGLGDVARFVDVGGGCGGVQVSGGCCCKRCWLPYFFSSSPCISSLRWLI